MPSENPIIRLNREVREAKRFKGPRPRFPSKLPFARQARRLGKKFDAVAANVLSFERGTDVSDDPRAVVPERALVIELLGAVRDFEAAATSLGFEWLTSVAPGLASDDLVDVDEVGDDIEEDDESDFQAMSVLYVTMPSQQGLKRLLRAWQRFVGGEEPSKEEKPLWALFGYMKDLRTWSAKDRIDPIVNGYVTALLDADPAAPVKVELDLWYRSEKQRRDSVISTVKDFVTNFGGKVLDLVEIPEIKYQGALIEIPAKVAKDLREQSGDLPNLKEVMTIRPQAAFEPAAADQVASLPSRSSAPSDLKPCVAAVLDGYPVAAHQRLDGRLVVLESDVVAAGVPASSRYHGTAMCSLIVHGDLADNANEPISRKLAIVPVLGYSLSGGADRPPEGQLAIGIIYRAILKLLAERKKNPELRDLVVVNHSICDTNAPFVRRPSPWAALLDHFSHHHRLLFVTSAGNVRKSFPCYEFTDSKELALATPRNREAAFLVSIEKAKATRTILSPAESVNALTVGALHSDAGPEVGPGEIDPFRRGRMTNLASAVGLGVNRSVKPDLLCEGGRFLVRTVDIPGGGVTVHLTGSPNAGHWAASPAPTGALQHVAANSGTSNAAALVTRSCIQIADRLDEAFAPDGENWHDKDTRAVMLKALAMHGCSWGDLGPLLEDFFPPEDSRKAVARRNNIARFLGFGPQTTQRVLKGGSHSATLLAESMIKASNLHEYRVPVPPSVLRNRELRRLVLTLAWSTPIMTTTADYRGVTLDIVDSQGKRAFWDGVKRGGVLQPPGKRSGEQGTVQHLILEGKTLRKSADEAGIFIGVQARERHPSQADASVPYALAVTLELAQPQRSRLYQEVRDAVRARARPRTRTRT